MCGYRIPPLRPFRRSPASPPPFEPNVVGYPTTNENGKTPVDARKRGVLGNQFIGNIPTANPCSNLPGVAWPFHILLAQSERAGQACEAPDASSILAEDAITFG
jgi:hypothetical protein